MSKKNILFIKGVSDNRKVFLEKINKDGTLNIFINGSANIYSYIHSNKINSAILTLDASPSQDIPLYDIHSIFNEISDPDTHKITLSKLDNMYENMSQGIRLFNAPSNIIKTTRDNIYKDLQEIEKLHVPKTIKFHPRSPADIYDAIEKWHFEFPVIFRQAGDHGGISTIKVDNDTEQFDKFALDGRDYYLTQYVDISKDGMYSKYRLVVVNSEVFINDVMFGKTWLVNNETQEEDNTLKEISSKNFIKKVKPLIQPIITKIQQRLGLDYFGIDCYIDEEMNLFIFEINANMSIFRGENTKEGIFKDHVKMTHDAVIDMLSS